MELPYSTSFTTNRVISGEVQVKDGLKMPCSEVRTPLSPRAISLGQLNPQLLCSQLVEKGNTKKPFPLKDLASSPPSHFGGPARGTTLKLNQNRCSALVW